jgi:hypothetical protein
MVISNYTGEEIIAKIIIKGGKKTEEREWFPRSVHNDPAGKDAYIIGNGPSRIGFDLYKLPQDSYGCNALYRDYEPDFLVCVDRRMYVELKDSEYIEKNIVYTNHFNMSRLGGPSHLIPQNPHAGAGTTAMHIAIHDGHTNLICLGFDCAEDGPNLNVYTSTNAYNDAETVVHQTVWGRQITEFIRKNPQVNWTFVEGNVPTDILNLDNVRAITYNELNTYIT